MSGELDREMVSYVLQDGVARITLDHPQRRNALSSELVGELGDRLHLAQGAEGVRVIVLTNSGSTFCAGADLKEAREPARAQPGRRRLADIFELMAMGPRPVVGRIAGHCFGGGVGLAAACDISVACDDAYFGFSEVRRGVAPAVISVVCLPKMRRCDAAELFLTGRRITASAAAEVGLVNRSVRREGLDEAVAQILDDLVAGGPEALAACKRLLREVPGSERKAALSWTSQLSAELFSSKEAKEGMAAFAERRDPAWVPGRPAGSDRPPG